LAARKPQSVRFTVDELREGSFTWDREELLRQAAAARE